jgi:hypothetical protein
VSTTRQVPPILGDGGEAATAEEMDYGSTRWSGTKGELTLHLRALRPASEAAFRGVRPDPAGHRRHCIRLGTDQRGARVIIPHAAAPVTTSGRPARAMALVVYVRPDIPTMAEWLGAIGGSVVEPGCGMPGVGPLVHRLRAVARGGPAGVR